MVTTVSKLVTHSYKPIINLYIFDKLYKPRGSSKYTRNGRWTSKTE